MQVIVKRVAKEHGGELEARINRVLGDPANVAYSVAAVFQASNGDIVVVFQKP